MSEPSEFTIKIYDIIQDKIVNLESVCMRQKGWAITTWTALTAVALKGHNWELAALPVVPLFFYFLLDMSYKSFQEQFLILSIKLERFIIEGYGDNIPYADLLPGKQISGKLFIRGLVGE